LFGTDNHAQVLLIGSDGLRGANNFADFCMAENLACLQGFATEFQVVRPAGRLFGGLLRLLG